MKRCLVALFGWVLCAGSAAAVQFELEYEAAIHTVVVLGKAQLRGQAGASAFSFSGGLQTTNFGALFDDTRLTVASNGTASTGALRMNAYSLVHNYAKKSRRTILRRGPAGVQPTAIPAYKDLGDPPASLAQINASNDPLTSILALAIEVGRSRACQGRASVFDGRQHYALSLRAATRGTYRGGGYSGDALICRMRYEPISGFKPMGAAERARIPEATIWFAAGAPAGAGFAPPLRIAVPTPLGEARLDLKKYKVSA